MTKKFLLIAALVAAACDGDNGSGPGPSLTLSADSVDVMIGNTTTVTATVANADGALQFVSRNSGIAQASNTGSITGIFRMERRADGRDSAKERQDTPKAGSAAEPVSPAKQ